MGSTGSGVWGRMGEYRGESTVGSGEIFGSLGSWVKYVGNIEGVGKCRILSLHPNTLPSPPPHSNHRTSPLYTSLSTSLHPSPLSTLSHLSLPPTLLHTPTHFPTPSSTLFHIPYILNPTPQTTQNYLVPSPSKLSQNLYTPNLLHTPHPSHFPWLLYHLPHTNISHFSRLSPN